MPAPYEHIPGVVLTQLETGMVAVRTSPSTESVLIIGPAVDGPTEEIIRVTSTSVIENLFGPIGFSDSYPKPTGVPVDEKFNGNYLMRAMREVIIGGGGDIRLLRVGGTKATGTLSVTGNAASGDLDLEARYAGRIYNQTTVTFTSGATSGKVVVDQADRKGGQFTLTWSGEASGLTVREVIDRINQYGPNKTVRLSIDTVDPTAAARLLNGSVTLTGGLDGTLLDDDDYRANLYSALSDATTGAFQFLEDQGYEVDIVLLAGIYLDDQVVTGGSANTTSIATKFSEYLARRTMDYPQVGVIGVRPIKSAASRSDINDHYDALTTSSAGARGTSADEWINAGYFMNAGFRYQDATRGLDIDAGGYMPVVAADVIYADREIGNYVESAAANVAGRLARLKPAYALTNEPVGGIFDVPYFFTLSQINTMTGGVGRDETQAREGKSAYVTIRRNDGVVYTRDVTAAARDANFKDLQPCRIANAVHKGIKQLAKRYLGKPNDLALRLSMETELRQFLDQVAASRALMGGEGIGYDLHVAGGDTDPLSNLLGIVHIEVVLRPALQVKEVRVTVRMSLNQ